MPKPKLNKEEVAESYCFVCKDGGSLRICDHTTCLKVYHSQCVKKDDSFLESDDRWLCGWHYCFLCGKSAKFQCFSCPIAVCGRCLCDTSFSVVTHKYGFCQHCLELGLLLEDKSFSVSNKGTVNFDDTETYEYFFKLYWEFIKEKEGLTLGHLHTAHGLLKENKNYKYNHVTNKKFGIASDSECQVDISDSSSDQTDMRSKKTRKRKRAGAWLSENARQRKENSKKSEFVGWASRSLLDFLQSVGANTSNEMSEFDVATVIIEYCHKQKLFHPEKRKKINCDKRLQLLFGKKSVSKNRIRKLLQVHFAENMEESEEAGDSSREHDEDVKCPAAQHNKIPNERFEEQVSRGSFASIVPGNIKLVYLRRSLVLELAKQSDTFERKVIGSFVRVKSDPNDCFQRNPRQLVQVTGIKGTVTDQQNPGVLLEVSNLLKEVPILDLLNDDFTEEECQDLCQRMKGGLLIRPTVGELQDIARVLHEDITKHWIGREIELLQRRIDRANEKGWRRDTLYDYINKKKMLMDPSEQMRLLQAIPVVIAERDEHEDVPGTKSPSKKDQHEQDDCNEMTFKMSPKTPRSILELNPFGRQHGKAFSGKKIPPPTAEVSDAAAMNHDDLNTSEYKIANKVGRSSHRPEDAILLSNVLNQSSPAADDQTDTVHQQQKQQHLTETAKGKRSMEQDKRFVSPDETWTDPHCQIWFCVSPDGTTVGPYSMRVLKRWHDTDTSTLDIPYKAWRCGQRPEDAILLSNILSRSSPAAGDQTDKVHERQHLTEIAREKKPMEHDECFMSPGETWRDPRSKIWFCAGPDGSTTGPYSMTVLKRWYETETLDILDIQYKVWRSGQRLEEAVPLAHAIRQMFDA